jgi:hypothetical protein
MTNIFEENRIPTKDARKVGTFHAFDASKDQELVFCGEKPTDLILLQAEAHPQ